MIGGIVAKDGMPPTCTLLLGDCLDVLPDIPYDGAHVVICDPPYGTTQCKWDSVIPLEPLWAELSRIAPTQVLTATQPFTTALVGSNLRDFKYTIAWKKSKCINFAQARNMPLKMTEDVCVFSTRKIGHKGQLGDRRMTYNPQGLVKVDKAWSRPRRYESGHRFSRDSHKLDRVIEFENYPSTLIEFGNSSSHDRGLHQTQKPVALMEYLVATFSNPGDTVLDFAMGSGTTGVAALKLGRNFIGIENDPHFHEVATRRLFGTDAARAA